MSHVSRFGSLLAQRTVVCLLYLCAFCYLVFTGIVFSALVHAWDSGTHVDADIEVKPMIINGEDHNVKYFKIKGAIFFSSVRKFIEMFNIAEDPPMIIIDFEYALVVDHSAVAAIHGITHRFAKVGKKVLLVNLAKKCHGRLHRTGDHEMLRRQITPAFHVQNVSDSEDEPEPPRMRRSSSAEPGTQTPPLSDHHDESRRLLEDLPMFSAGIDPVETEVEVLYEEQGEWSIHEKKSK